MEFEGDLKIDFFLTSSTLNIETDWISGWLRLQKQDESI